MSFEIILDPFNPHINHVLNRIKYFENSCKIYDFLMYYFPNYKCLYCIILYKMYFYIIMLMRSVEHNQVKSIGFLVLYYYLPPTPPNRFIVLHYIPIVVNLSIGNEPMT